MEEEKRDHDLKMKKMEAEMEQVFEMKVKEKKQKLKDSELELTRRHDERKKVCVQLLHTARTFLLTLFFSPTPPSRHLSCKFVNWRSVSEHSNKRNTIGKAQMVLLLMNCDAVASRPIAKSEYYTFLKIH